MQPSIKQMHARHPLSRHHQPPPTPHLHIISQPLTVEGQVAPAIATSNIDDHASTLFLEVWCRLHEARAQGWQLHQQAAAMHGMRIGAAASQPCKLAELSHALSRTGLQLDVPHGFSPSTSPLTR